MIKSGEKKNVHTPGAHLLKSCTRPWKCARRVQGAPLISDTVQPYITSQDYTIKCQAVERGHVFPEDYM